MPRDGKTVTIEPWQERILRRSHHRATVGDLAAMCERSPTWVRMALRLLQIETMRMRALRKAQELRDGIDALSRGVIS